MSRLEHCVADKACRGLRDRLEHVFVQRLESCGPHSGMRASQLRRGFSVARAACCSTWGLLKSGEMLEHRGRIFRGATFQN